MVGKMLRATHKLWMERNHILHLRTAGCIKGLEMIALETAVVRQLDIGHGGLAEADMYLLAKDKASILIEPVENIRSWLCDIMIARGDFDSARLESLQDRGELTHLVPNLTAAETRRYLDWRTVRLSRRYDC